MITCRCSSGGGCSGLYSLECWRKRNQSQVTAESLGFRVPRHPKQQLLALYLMPSMVLLSIPFDTIQPALAAWLNWILQHVTGRLLRKIASRQDLLFLTKDLLRARARDDLFQSTASQYRKGHWWRVVAVVLQLIVAHAQAFPPVLNISHCFHGATNSAVKPEDERTGGQPKTVLYKSVFESTSASSGVKEPHAKLETPTSLGIQIPRSS